MYDSNECVKNSVYCSNVWEGTKSMIKNNSEKLNEHVFWENFSKVMGDKVLEHKPLFEDFYSNDFDLISTFLLLSSLYSLVGSYELFR